MTDIIERRSESAVPTSAAYANVPAWHGVGTVFDTGKKKGMTVEQALPAAGLDFEVQKVPIYGPNKQLIEKRYGVMRTDTEEILGVVGEQWTPVQNLEGLAIVNDVISTATDEAGYKLWIESAFALEGGRKVCVLVHIDEDWQIAGEEYKSYLLFTNGHDGRLAVTTAAVDMRAVCANTLNYAIYVEGKETSRVVRVRHTRSAAERIKEASHILRMRNLRKEELAKQGEWLVEEELSDEQFSGFLEALMPLDSEQADKPAGTMIRARRDQVSELYYGAENLAPIRGTRWGAVQAVVEYADYGRAQRGQDQRMKSQLGLFPAPIKDRALQLLTV